MLATTMRRATHLALEKDSRTVKRAGRILCRPVLGGLHHEYDRIWFSDRHRYPHGSLPHSIACDAPVTRPGISIGLRPPLTVASSSRQYFLPFVQCRLLAVGEFIDAFYQRLFLSHAEALPTTSCIKSMAFSITGQAAVSHRRARSGSTTSTASLSRRSARRSASANTFRSHIADIC
jgi:hypothetical protein